MGLSVVFLMKKEKESRLEPGGDAKGKDCGNCARSSIEAELRVKAASAFQPSSAMALVQYVTSEGWVAFRNEYSALKLEIEMSTALHGLMDTCDLCEDAFGPKI